MNILSEVQIQEVFEVFHEHLLEPGLTFVGTQQKLENELLIDIAFIDNLGRNVWFVIKKDTMVKEDRLQISMYADLIKKGRVIMASPIISTPIKAKLDHQGIEYLEFDLGHLETLYSRIKNKPKQQRTELSKQWEDSIYPVKLPLLNNTKKDGNVAFKVTYNDNDWSGVCSPKVADYNFANRTWCGIQAEFEINCQSTKYRSPSELNLQNFPCYDCLAKKELTFYPGHYHGEKHNNEPIRSLEAKVGKIALFTSREPEERENARFIFAIAQMEYFEIVEVENGDDYERFHCNKETAIFFDKNNRPKYWNYYRNPNNPNRIAWNTGLIRYVSDSVIITLLENIIQKKMYSILQKENAIKLLTQIK